MPKKRHSDSADDAENRPATARKSAMAKSVGVARAGGGVVLMESDGVGLGRGLTIITDHD